jgi:CubicO group peptidase (beta-lactamase class C family)
MKRLLPLLLSFVFPLFVLGQTPSLQKSPPLTDAPPASVGLSAERLARIETMCENAVADEVVPGMVVLVARKGKIVLHEAYGTADAQAKRRLKKDAIFRIASQSKAITSTAVMMLWEEGHFNLDDPISRYIPEFKNPQVLTGFRYADTTFRAVPAKREITIRHLLTHTSGLGYGVIDGDERFQMLYHKAGVTDLFTTKPITIEQSVKKLATLPLHHHPGEDYTYSEGLDVLGYFIEIISGQPFDEFLRERLFDPLGMDDTWFYLPDNKADRLVTVQTRDEKGWKPLPITFYDPAYPVKGAKTFFSGGAGLCSTAKDYATFLQMYLNGGELNGTRILSRKTVELIMTNQTQELWGARDRHYGLAFGVINEQGVAMGGRGSLGTFDWGGYFNTSYFADPQEQIIGLIMKQTWDIGPDPTSGNFRRLVGQAVDD